MSDDMIDWVISTVDELNSSYVWDESDFDKELIVDWLFENNMIYKIKHIYYEEEFEWSFLIIKNDEDKVGFKLMFED